MSTEVKVPTLGESITEATLGQCADGQRRGGVEQAGDGPRGPLGHHHPQRAGAGGGGQRQRQPQQQLLGHQRLAGGEQAGGAEQGE